MTEKQDTCDYLDKMCFPLEKLRGIAALFSGRDECSCEGLSGAESSGVCLVLKSIADEFDSLRDNATAAWKKEQ